MCVIPLHQLHTVHLDRIAVDLKLPANICVRTAEDNIYGCESVLEGVTVIGLVVTVMLGCFGVLYSSQTYNIKSNPLPTKL